MTSPKLRFPRDIDIALRFFGRFTAPDLARLLTPTLAAYMTTRLLDWPATVLIGGISLGMVLYAVRPYDLPLDQLTYHAVRTAAARRTSIVPTVDELQGGDRDASRYVVLKVTPTNLEMKREDEQAALHHVYQSLLETLDYPIQIISRQVPVRLDRYAEELNTSNEEVTAAYQERISEYGHGQVTETQHYIVARAQDAFSPWQRLLNTWYRLSPKIHPRFTSDEERSANTSAPPRPEELIQALDTPELDVERPHDTESHHAALQALHEHDTDPGIRRLHGQDGSVRRVAALTDYPATIPFGWPDHLLKMDQRIDIVQTIRPRNPADVTNQLQSALQNLTAEQGALLQGGFLGTNRLEAAIDDIDWMLDAVADRSEQLFDYGAYAIAHGDTATDCDQHYNELVKRLRGMRFDTTEPVFRADHATRTIAAGTPDTLDQTTLAPGSAVAAGFPFTTRSENAEHGILYGTDTSDGTPVIEDRFAWDAGHMVRMGATGSGKSYATKIALLRALTVHDDLQVRIIDPKGEYKAITDHVAGGRITLDQQDLDLITPSNDVVRYTVSDRINASPALLADAIDHIYQDVTDHPGRTIVVIDEAHRLLTDDTQRGALEQFVREARDTDTAITMITQTAADFTNSPEGRRLLDNVPGKVFMRHERVPDSVVEYFHLSERERQQLLSLKTGTDCAHSEAVMKITERLDAKTRIEPTPAERDIIEDP